MPVPTGVPMRPGRNGGVLTIGRPPVSVDLDALVTARVGGLSIAKAAVAAGCAADTARELLRRRDVIERIEAGKAEIRDDLHARINAASGEVIRVHLEAMKAVDASGYPTTLALRAAENLMARLAPATQQLAIEARTGPIETPEERTRRLDALLANIEARLGLPDGEREREVVALVTDEDGIADAEVIE